MKRWRQVTIGGIMWVTVVISLGLAALRNATETWGGVTFLVTLGVFACGAIAALCRPARERPWWLGFCTFGCGYMWLAFWGSQTPHLPRLPTTRVLDALAPMFHVMPHGAAKGQRPWYDPFYYPAVGHCVWALLLATLGGCASLGVCRVRKPAPNATGLPAERVERIRFRGWRRPTVGAFVGSTLLVLLTLVGVPHNEELIAGTVYLLTCTMLGAAILGAILGRDLCRAEWFGAALFGGFYLIYHLTALPDRPHRFVGQPANSFLGVMRTPLIRSVQALYGSVPLHSTSNFRVWQKLDKRIDMQFPQETSFEDVLKYIKQQTEAPGDNGIPIFLDPVELQFGQRTTTTSIQIDVQGLPLRTTLPLILAQLDMTYYVRDGVLHLAQDSPEATEHAAPDDPYLLLGHCILAWLAAGLGALLGPRMASRRREGVA